MRQQVDLRMLKLNAKQALCLVCFVGADGRVHKTSVIIIGWKALVNNRPQFLNVDE